MQWNPSSGAGFTSGRPWLPISSDSPRVNVETERSDPDSMLSLYRRLITLRKQKPRSRSAATPLSVERDLLAYKREAAGKRFLVALNLGHGPAQIELAETDAGGSVAVATERHRDGERVERRVVLNGDDGLVIRLDA